MATLIVKILIAVLLAMLVAFGLDRFQDIPGFATVEFAGYEIAMQSSSLIILLGVIFAVAWIGVAILRRGVSWFFSVAAWAQARKHKRGLDALSRALVALAEGDGRRAVNEAQRAETLLHNPDLTRLVNAQAARLAGDESRSERYFEAMAEDRDTDYLGVMGLLRAALAEKQYERALRLAERAHLLRPKKAEVIDILFDLQKRKGDWAGARQTLQSAVKAGRLTRDVADRRRAVINIVDSQAREAAGDAAGALEQAMAALRLAPGLAPASVAAARLLSARGETRAAARRLADAWRAEPHPDVAEAFAALAPDETPAARLKRFDKLFGANPKHPETKLLKAELALTAGNAALARDAIGDALATRPSARGFALMAAIEQAQGADEAAVRGWLARAATAPRAARWTCSACGADAAHWTHECGSCGAFDQLTWRQAPPEAEEAERTALALASPSQAVLDGLTSAPAALPKAEPTVSDASSKAAASKTQAAAGGAQPAVQSAPTSAAQPAPTRPASNPVASNPAVSNPAVPQATAAPVDAAPSGASGTVDAGVRTIDAQATVAEPQSQSRPNSRTASSGPRRRTADGELSGAQS